MKIKYFIIYLVFSIKFLGNNIYLTSLEWPPYTGKDLYLQGISSLIVKKAFEIEGYNLQIDFFPWSRVIYNVKENNKYIGYFPEYYSESLKDDFYFSDPIDTSILGFVVRINSSISWEKLEELGNYKIGIIQDYINTEEFDKLIKSNSLVIESVISDLLNIRKVAGRRIDMAVIDKNVLKYYLDHERTLERIKKQVKFNEQILEEKNTYVCFSKNENGKKMLDIFNSGLKKLDVEKIKKEYFLEY